MLAGHTSKTNRILLLHVFRPGLVISNIVVAVLLILQAVVLSGTYLYALNHGDVNGDFYFYAEDSGEAER